MIILDTNVLSALMRNVPDPVVVNWLDRQPRISVWTTCVTLFEIYFGIAIMAPGRRRSRLNQALERLVNEKIQRRVAAFDDVSAEAAAALMAARHQRAEPGDLRDTMIAGIALARRATLATGNRRHFTDLSVPVVDPWQTSD